MTDEVGNQILAALCEGEHAIRLDRRPCRSLPRWLARRLAAGSLVECVERRCRNRTDGREELMTSHFHSISL
jgi:hypothetical protein